MSYRTVLGTLYASRHNKVSTPLAGSGTHCWAATGVSICPDCYRIWNKYIGDDTKAAARQSPNCIKKQTIIIIKYGENDFQYGGWNSYILQCGTIMRLMSSGDCTMQCGMWLWEHNSELTKWQHPAMWIVALGWHAIEFAQTSAILEFYIWVRFRPYHCSRHVILHQSAKFYPNWTTLGRKKMTSCRFSRWHISAILDFRGSMGSMKPMYDFL